MGQEVAASDIARALAAAKAISVSSLHRDRYVLAADQTLDCQGQRFHKPADRTEAATQLMQLAGRSHRLHSAFALARDGRILTEGEQSADLVMRAFDDAFVARYLALAGTGVLGSVGCYRLEGLGAQLFERIDGDHFTILGLPLLPVLTALRAQGCLVS
jgi:septum formation protein